MSLCLVVCDHNITLLNHGPLAFVIGIVSKPSTRQFAYVMFGNLHSNRTEVIEGIMIFVCENKLEFEMIVS